MVVLSNPAQSTTRTRRRRTTAARANNDHHHHPHADATTKRHNIVLVRARAPPAAHDDRLSRITTTTMPRPFGFPPRRRLPAPGSPPSMLPHLRHRLLPRQKRGGRPDSRLLRSERAVADAGEPADAGAREQDGEADKLACGGRWATHRGEAVTPEARPGGGISRRWAHPATRSGGSARSPPAAARLRLWLGGQPLFLERPTATQERAGAATWSGAQAGAALWLAAAAAPRPAGQRLRTRTSARRRQLRPAES